jgi:hypothetical protein
MKILTWRPVLAVKVLLAGVLVLGAGCSEVEDPSLGPVTDPRFVEPAPPLGDLGRDPQRNVFWGDLHIIDPRDD